MKYQIFLSVVVIATGTGCIGTEGQKSPDPVPVVDPLDVAAEYPDLFALYAGDRGIYRGCGPNGGVCHNSREYPNFSNLGSIVESIGLDCNQKRDVPLELNDLCERTGDRLNTGVSTAEIAFIEAIDPPDGEPMLADKWRIHLVDEVEEGEELQIVRGNDLFFDLYDYDASATFRGGKIVELQLAPPEPLPPGEEEDDPYYLPRRLATAGVPGDPTTIQVADPNRNGVLGAALGGKLIAPGDPGRSYLMKRLIDPEAGPLMPRANCCFWSKSSLRALYCWISGLRPDGTNALDPIDYASCPPGPDEHVKYPEPGPSCETSGLCPVRIEDPSEREPTWPNVYRVLSERCSASGCHAAPAAAELDFSTSETAARDLAMRDRVVPGRPEASVLMKRIDPTLCVAPDCVLMPRDRPALEAEVRALIAAWITGGAVQ